MCSTHTGYTPLSYAVCDRKSIIRCVQTESDWAYDRHLYTSNSMTSDVIRFCKHPSMLVCSALLFVYVNDNRLNCMNSDIDCDCGCALCEQNRKKNETDNAFDICDASISANDVLNSNVCACRITNFCSLC